MRCAIYYRVSTSGQRERDTIEIQKAELPPYAKSQGWEIVGVYEDEGISGKSIDERPEFQRLLNDAKKKLFDVLLVWKHDRISRTDDLSERGLILQTFVENNIKTASPGEGIRDPGSFDGELLSVISYSMAAEERRKIAERTIKGKIKAAKAGKYVVGRMPFGRTQNKKTLKWSLDEFKANLIRKSAYKYIQPDGPTLYDLAEEMTKAGAKISEAKLSQIFREQLGDTLVTRFKSLNEPVIYKVPRFVSDSMIEKVHEKLVKNRIWNRTDRRVYVLTGYVFCGKCNARLGGQLQQEKYRYYRHAYNNKASLCDHFKSISARNLEKAVFETIFESVYDIPSFKEAIRDEIPDQNRINRLKESLRIDKAELGKVEAKLGKLVDVLLNGTIDRETVEKRNDELVNQKETLQKSIAVNQRKLDEMPDPVEFKKEQYLTRLSYLDYFGSKEHFDSMTFKEKRALLDLLFSGTDEFGEPLGIFIHKISDGIWKYVLNARLFQGFRYIKGQNINYHAEHLDEDYQKWLIEQGLEPIDTTRKKPYNTQKRSLD